jgi:phosphate acetyltransferase
MDYLKEWFEKAKAKQKSLVLPETEDARTYQAAEKILAQGLASTLYLLGNKDDVQNKAKELGVSIEGAEIIDPATDPRKEAYATEYFNMRKHKGLSESEAATTLLDRLFFAAMMLRKGDADAVVAGAHNTTGDVLRAAIQVVGTPAGVKTVSSAFIMVMPDTKWGANGILFFSDCAVLPDPNPEQLADIAISTAATCKALTGADPKVAMLSFSTKGSAKNEMTDKVVKAVEILKSRNVDFEFDGELQLDAAMIESVGKSKAPGSNVAGQANCLIFPDLNAGNIGYKLTQRFGNAQALGPVMQGLAKPYNDLSRGCSVDDIVMTAAFALLSA